MLEIIGGILLISVLVGIFVGKAIKAGIGPLDRSAPRPGE